MRASPGLVAVLTLALLLAACGGGDDDDDGAAEGDEEATDAADEPGEAPTPAAGSDGERFPSEGCGSDPAFPAGFSRQTIGTGGQQRTHRLHVPGVHDGETPVPLVLSLGGYTTDADLHEEISDFEDLGESEGFVVATPDPLNDPRAWDTGEGSYDVVFMTDLLDALEAGLCVDLSRVYASGLSLGAIFTSRLACDLGDRLAAIGPVAGVRFAAGCDPGHAMPVISIHGTVDDLVPFDSGLEGAREWAEHNDCTGESVDETISDHVVAQVYEEGCAAPVELWVVNGGGHSWPGDDFLGGVNPAATTTEIDATQVIWEFLRQFSLPSAG